MPKCIKKFEIPNPEPKAYPVEIQRGDYGENLVIVQCIDADTASSQLPRKVASLVMQDNDNWQETLPEHCDWGSYPLGGLYVVNIKEPDRKVTQDEMQRYSSKDAEVRNEIKRWLRWRVTCRCEKGNR